MRSDKKYRLGENENWGSYALTRAGRHEQEESTHSIRLRSGYRRQTLGLDEPLCREPKETEPVFTFINWACLYLYIFCLNSINKYPCTIPIILSHFAGHSRRKGCPWDSSDFNSIGTPWCVFALPYLCQSSFKFPQIRSSFTSSWQVNALVMRRCWNLATNYWSKVTSFLTSLLTSFIIWSGVSGIQDWG